MRRIGYISTSSKNSHHFKGTSMMLPKLNLFWTHNSTNLTLEHSVKVRMFFRWCSKYVLSKLRKTKRINKISWEVIVSFFWSSVTKCNSVLCEKKISNSSDEEMLEQRKILQQKALAKLIIEVLTDIIQHLFRNLRFRYYMLLISSRILRSDITDKILTL